MQKRLTVDLRLISRDLGDTRDTHFFGTSAHLGNEAGLADVRLQRLTRALAFSVAHRAASVPSLPSRFKTSNEWMADLRQWGGALIGAWRRFGGVVKGGVGAKADKLRRNQRIAEELLATERSMCGP